MAAGTAPIAAKGRAAHMKPIAITDHAVEEYQERAKPGPRAAFVFRHHFHHAFRYSVEHGSQHTYPEEGAMTDKVRENRLRRMAERQGLALFKSRRRDPRAIDYGCWMIVDPTINAVVAGTAATGRPEMSLDDVEAWLTDEGR